MPTAAGLRRSNSSGLEGMMLDDSQVRDFKKQLESEGEEKVRDKLARGIYGRIEDPKTKAPMVKNWLEDKEKERAKTQIDEQVRISKETNKTAQHRNIMGWVVGIGGLLIGIVGICVSVYFGIENNGLRSAQQNVFNYAQSIKQNNFYYNFPPAIKNNVDKNYFV